MLTQLWYVPGLFLRHTDVTVSVTIEMTHEHLRTIFCENITLPQTSFAGGINIYIAVVMVHG